MTAPAWTGRRAARLTRLTLDTWGTVCHLCSKPGATTADHITPRSHGGDDSIDNLRPAHMLCNSQRGTMTLDEWFASRALAFDGRDFFSADPAATPRLAPPFFPTGETKTAGNDHEIAGRPAAEIDAEAAAFFAPILARSAA